MITVMLAASLALFVGIVGGLVMGAQLAKEDLRRADRDIRVMRAACDSAGLRPFDAPAPGPDTAVPTHAEGRYTP